MPTVSTFQNTPITLANGESLYVATTGQLFVDTGVVVTVGQECLVTVAGEVWGMTGNAIQFSDDLSTIIVRPGGLVTAGTGANAVYGAAGTTDNLLINHGSIAASGNAVLFEDGANSVVNYGDISAGNEGVTFRSSLFAASVTNYGSISGGQNAIRLDTDQNDIVRNFGILGGDVFLGGGDDLLDSSQGIVTGWVLGGTGDDTLILGAGNDTIVGGAGSDDIRGGDGFDTASYAQSSVAATASLANPAINRGDAFGDTYDSIEGLSGTRYADNLTGNSAANVLDGADGDDTMTGGSGDDLYYVGSRYDVVTETAGGGRDTIYTDVGYALGAGSEIERLLVRNAAATDSFNFTGNNFANTVAGNAGGNTIAGLDGNDAIDGRAGGDLIYGGRGNDLLTGGNGLDHFYFDTALDAANNVDRITDFKPIDDTIRLSRTVFTQIPAGTLPTAAFHLGTAAADASDRIIYDPASGNVWYDSDGLNGVAQTLFAQLQPGLAVTANDFVGY